jgi:diguanylate cyclase (GGDEF)-like protein
MHVVVVDPSRTVLKILRLLLEARSHHVYAFTGGAEALKHIEADPQIDAAIFSAEQFDGSGVELCWHARLLASSFRPIYIILMSSHDGKRTLIEALDGGADDFIAKPPIPEELYARLRAAERVTSLQRQLIRLATTDPLTGMLNRRSFFERALHLCERAESGYSVSTIMMDIDHFKSINDGYGHGVGDQVLVGVAAAAREAGEIVGRLGGEEFAVLLEAEDSFALKVAERVRATIASTSFPTSKGALSVTCSFGVSQWHQGDNIDELLRRADIALYAAKAGGRNQVVPDQPGLWIAEYDRQRRPIRNRVRTSPAALSGAMETPAPGDGSTRQALRSPVDETVGETRPAIALTRS